MDTLASARERFAFESWKNANTLARNLFVWNYRLSGEVLPGWELIRIQTFELEGQPRLIRSLWSRRGGHLEMRIAVDIYESVSRVAAHELMVRLLASFENPLIERKTIQIGDVAFSGPPENWIAFARANLVFLIRNEGLRIVRFDEEARRLDDDVAREPSVDPAEVGIIPSLRSMASKVQIGDDVRLVPDEVVKTAYLKIYYGDGELSAEGRTLVFRPAQRNAQNLMVYAVSAQRRVAATTIHVGAG